MSHEQEDTCHMRRSKGVIARLAHRQAYRLRLGHGRGVEAGLVWGSEFRVQEHPGGGFFREGGKRWGLKRRKRREEEETEEEEEEGGAKNEAISGPGLRNKKRTAQYIYYTQRHTHRHTHTHTHTYTHTGGLLSIKPPV